MKLICSKPLTGETLPLVLTESAGFVLSVQVVSGLK